ncbi:LysM peptidoglycan-binding domain-containing protein [Flavobacterium cellulosilyticum]|uniref:LysM peptidoglycan-binding domain-containing protein n=1 Tax=Flavobacterium cellulosilyticum TaxID=2541731 RepID=A0A4R5CHK1_9FLAO|nr:LysM peptidoglycan-binding domain-containing protein [Flavobacterium cellulosilyticum]TDD99678.1 LysM peptidoglycan-binding domain-containing protein [Flavobacterium cellulosilyticum]
MKIKKISLLLFSVLSIHSYSQNGSDNRLFTKTETNYSFLDSIKKTFVVDEMASCVDSLWMNEMASLDIYNDISGELNTVNTDKNVDSELPTELLKARLKAMDEKSPFHIEYNQSLENLIKSFLKNRKKSFGRQMAVSEYYFPIFEEALSRQNVPLEIKYLAVVESSLNPKAVSKSGATGLWQFMYQTGKQYNLNIDSYVDERSDPLKSSAAATQYMTNMYTIFGDWDLVLASYNSGPGNVAKAIRRSGGQQNYWNIRKNLPLETQGYVPAFLATMYIYEYHKEHGIIADRAILKHFETDTVRIKKQMSFKQISDLVDVPVKQLELLNPSYKLDVVPYYSDQNHYLRLPKEKIAVFTSNENQIYAYIQHESDLRERPYQSSRTAFAKANGTSSSQTSQSSSTYYTVKKGDNLSAIAEKYDVSLEDLKEWNGLKSNSVDYGINLKIISNENVASVVRNEPKILKTTKEVVAETKNNKTDSSKKSIKADTLSTEAVAYHVVQKGDNLGNIAKKYNVTIDELKEWNHISDNSIQLAAALQVGVNELNAKEEIAFAPVPEFENVEYIVKKGDNLGNIAKKFGSTMDDLKEWNNIQGNNIALGSSIIVAKSEIAITKATPRTNTLNKKESLVYTSKNSTNDYLVKKGDSLFSIAKKYPGVTISDIKKWNDIRTEDLKPGMKLKING